MISRIQKLKKKAQLVLTDEVTIFYDVPSGYVNDVISNYFQRIQTAVRATFVKGTCPMFAESLADAKEELKGEFFPGKTMMKLQVAHGTIDPNAPQKPAMKFESFSNGTVLLENPRGVKTQNALIEQHGNGAKWETKFVNLQFVGKDRYGVVDSNTATVVLNNPGHEVSELDQVRLRAARLFGWNGDESAIELFFDPKTTKKVTALSDCTNATVFVKNVVKPIS